MVVATCDFSSAAVSQGSSLLWVSNCIRAPAQSVYGSSDGGADYCLHCVGVEQKLRLVHAQLESESNP